MEGVLTQDGMDSICASIRVEGEGSIGLRLDEGPGGVGDATLIDTNPYRHSVTLSQ